MEVLLAWCKRSAYVFGAPLWQDLGPMYSRVHEECESQRGSSEELVMRHGESNSLVRVATCSERNTECVEHAVLSSLFARYS